MLNYMKIIIFDQNFDFQDFFTYKMYFKNKCIIFEIIALKMSYNNSIYLTNIFKYYICIYVCVDFTVKFIIHVSKF